MVWCVAAAVWLFPLLVGAADLTVQVTGLRNTAGYMRLSLYDRAETFLNPDGRIARMKVSIESTPVRVNFAGLRPGTYAVTVHHDENGNGQLDRNIVGLPREGYGFSNDARGTLGPPSFASAAVTLEAEDKVITITLRY
jgi:uncharacterized protein (DUF2141 family)